MGEILMSLALQMEYRLVHTTCYKCGVAMFIPDDMNKKFLRTGDSFYCINGHDQHYIGELEETKLKRQLKVERDTNTFLRKQNEQERNRTRGQKAAKTRIKNRIKNGVCPCCNRTFKQLAAHMKNKHPEYMEHKK